MTTVYRIRHKPTGMYFCPSREIKVKLLNSRGETETRYVKSNLSKTGKTYLRKPTLKQIGRGYYTHLITHLRELKYYNSLLVPRIDSEWEIETVGPETTPMGEV